MSTTEHGDGHRPERARPARRPPGKHTLKWLIAPVIVLIVCSNVANVMWPTLSEDHPLTLIALSSINRYLLLVSDRLDPVSYYLVGTARLVVSDPLFFLLGYWYGDRALDWLDRKSPTYGPMLRRFQDLFGKAAWPLVVIAPNQYICLFAGAAGMRASLFFALNIAGTVGRLYLIRVTGAVFSSPIEGVQDFIGRYRWQLIVVSALLVAWSLRNEIRGQGQIEDLVHLEQELEAQDLDAAEPDAEELGDEDEGATGA